LPAAEAPFYGRQPTLEAAEEALISEALARTAGNQGVAAGILGISRQALNKRLSRRRKVDQSSST
jgi:DNA-binding NtrC family response regulator